MFIHFLLTRFNIIFTRGINKNVCPFDEEWHNHRFILFDKYCFPSVKNQTNQNFKWLVFFNIDTPDKYRNKIEEYRNAYANFFPVFTDQPIIPSAPDTINTFLQKDTTHIITSRLDNDDAIHINYINKIQSCFCKQDFCLVDIKYGYVYRIEPAKKLAIKRKDNNSFISLIESIDSFKTVFSKWHNEWAIEKRRIIIKDRLWLHIVHDKNIFNNMREASWFIFKYDLLKDFSISKADASIKYKDYFNMLKDNILLVCLKVYRKVIFLYTQHKERGQK